MTDAPPLDRLAFHSPREVGRVAAARVRGGHGLRGWMAGALARSAHGGVSRINPTAAFGGAVSLRGELRGRRRRVHLLTR